MLILSRKVDEKIKIGDNITITLIEVRGDQVKIGVEAPKNVKVFRQEVFNKIRLKNYLFSKAISASLLRRYSGPSKSLRGSFFSSIIFSAILKRFMQVFICASK